MHCGATLQLSSKAAEGFRQLSASRRSQPALRISSSFMCRLGYSGWCLGAFVPCARVFFFFLFTEVYVSSILFFYLH